MSKLDGFSFAVLTAADEIDVKLGLGEIYLFEKKVCLPPSFSLFIVVPSDILFSKGLVVEIDLSSLT